MTDLDPKLRQAWEDFLNPDVMRPALITVSVYIAAFEALKDAIVRRIREFYVIGFDKSGMTVGPKYDAQVLSRNRSPLYASLDWLNERGVLSEDDLRTFDRLKGVETNSHTNYCPLRA